MITVDQVDELLKYFHQELSYLKSKGVEFATQYPKIAGHLELGPDGSNDPNVERLIESVAFLTARMQRDIDKKFPEYSQQLLESLYPHLVTPVPPITVAEFKVDTTKISSPEGFIVPKDTHLNIKDLEGNGCAFKTCYEARLWPISISGVSVVDLSHYGVSSYETQARKGIKISLKSHGMPFSALALNHLDFYLNGERSFTHKIYDAVMRNASGIYIVNGSGNNAQHMRGARFNTKGIDSREQILPMPGKSHPAYGVLMDYFSFPKKFHYISLWDLNFQQIGTECSIILPIIDENIPDVFVDNFKLGVVPIINLFNKTSEPLKLDHTALKYKLVGDVKAEDTTEIHTIKNVVIIDDETGESTTIAPYFAQSKWQKGENSSLSWHITRETSRFGGFDVYLSFVDENFDPKVLTTSTVYAETLCTNRGLAELIPVGAILNPEIELPTTSVSILSHATQQRQLAKKTDAYWKLVEHLNLNHLSLTSLGAEGLKNVLKLYADETEHAMVNGIVDVTQNLVTRRLTTDAWRGFVQGVELIFTLDERAFQDSSPIILGHVLRQFLGLYTSINSFVEIKMKWKHTGEIWKEWVPLSGRQQLL